ncbi:MAG: sulfur carrier protein ThiS [Pseudomonadota bacterium]
MKITLNGAPREVMATRLSDLLEECGFGDAKVATAVNEDFVPASERRDTTISNGDRVEVVAPRQGG